MHSFTIALFGESERGTFQRAHHCDSLQQLVDHLGNPPPDSRGLAMAVQALMYERRLLFFRVAEEGFSSDDYYRGLRSLEKGEVVPNLAALALPGVGDPELLEACHGICRIYHSILITTERDLYDYLTSQQGHFLA